jgi:hypothetical protein
MRINLESLNPQKSQDFLHYFTAKLKAKNETSILLAGSARYNDSGQFESKIQDTIRTESNTDFPIEWKIIQNSDGTIPFIEVLPQSGDIPNECLTYVNEFINEVLINVFAEVRKKFFHRSYFCYLGSNKLKTEFWINSSIRIGPLFPDDTSIHPVSERILVIDQNVEAVDLLHSKQLSEERSIQIAAQLSFLLNIGLYTPRREERWFTFKDEETSVIKNLRQITGFSDSNCPTEMPKKGEILPINVTTESISRIECYTFDDLTFPKETKRILRAVEKVQGEQKLAFYRCCRLYQTGLSIGIYYPTIKLSYLYSSIDCICKITGQYNGFSDFILRFNPSVDKDLLDLIHRKIRSAHWHTGVFYLGEEESRFRDYILDREHILKFNLIQIAQVIIRQSIIEWIFQEIVNKNST